MDAVVDVRPVEKEGMEKPSPFMEHQHWLHRRLTAVKR
jgi:hypothetical protein